ncbi:MAG: hypothetical protein EBZ61_11305 [Micrococcales bacterium]|nr:hypothetical protein [Micrococcales bacterium]
MTRDGRDVAFLYFGILLIRHPSAELLMGIGFMEEALLAKMQKATTMLLNLAALYLMSRKWKLQSVQGHILIAFPFGKHLPA